MSPAVPTGLSGAAVAKALERGGFEHVSTRGSHAKYRSGEQTVFVPFHRSLAPGRGLGGAAGPKHGRVQRVRPKRDGRSDPGKTARADSR